VVDNVLKVHREGQTIFLGFASRGATTTAATAAADTTTTFRARTATSAASSAARSTAAADAPRTTRASASALATIAGTLGRAGLFLATKAPGLADSEIRDHRPGPVAEIARNDPFSGRGVGIERAKFCDDDSGLREIGGQRRPVCKHCIAVQVAPNCDIKRRAGGDDQKWIQ